MPRKNTRLGGGSGGTSSSGFASLGGGAGSSSFVPSGNAVEDLAAYRQRGVDAALARGDVPGFDGQSPEGDYTRALIRLLKSPDPKAQEAAKSLADQPGVDPVTAAALGVSGLIDKSKQDSVGGRVLHAAKPGLEALKFIGRPANALEELIQAGAQDIGLDKVMTSEAFLPENSRPTRLESNDKNGLSPDSKAARHIIGDAAGSGGYRDALSALWGSKRWDPVAQKFTDDLSFAHALGVDPTQLPGASGRIAGGADFVGTAALDPLNFVGAGEARAAGTAAEKAAGIVVAEGAARELTPALSRQLGRLGAEQGAERLAPELVKQAIQRTGLRSALTPAQRAALEETLRAEAAAGGGRTTRNLITGAEKTAPLKEDGLIRKTTLALTGQGGRSADEKVAQDLLTQAERFDRGGLRVAGRSIVPEAVRSPVRTALKGDLIQVGAVNAEARIAEDAANKVDDLWAKSQKAAEKAQERIAQADEMYDDPEKAVKLFSKAKAAQTRADTLAAKAEELDAAVQSGSVDDLLAADPGLGHIREPVVEQVPRKILPNKNLTGTFKGEGGAAVSGVDKLREWFQPRARIDASVSLPSGTADKYKEAVVRGAGVTKQDQQVGARLLNTYAKDPAVLTPEFTDGLRRALDIGGDYEGWKAGLTPEQAKAADALAGLKDYTYDLNVKHGLADVLKLRKKDEYLARYLTDEGLAAARKYADLYPDDVTFRQFSTAKQAAGQGGHLLKRSRQTADWTLDELNADMTRKLVDAGYLKAGENALELDPAKIIARRFDDTMPALLLNRQMRAAQQDVKGILGEDLIHVIDPGKKIPKGLEERGFQAIPLGVGDEAGTIVAHPDLVPEITQFVKMTVQPDAVGDFGKLMDGWNRLWKSYATVPLLTGTGFHVKNSIGNMFNNYLAGVKSYAYKDAIEIQKDIWQAKRAFPELSVPEAMAANGVAPERVAKAELALEHQVLEEGFFNTDLHGKADLAIKSKKPKGQRLGAKFDVRNPDEMFGVPTGRKVGEHIEDNARLAHFISKLDETGDAAAAATSVRKYLFDYGDLTPFERKVMKRIHAFYTFTRKNTPLQFAEIARNPAAVNRLALAKDTVLGGGEQDTSNMPSYMNEIGAPFGKSQSRALTGGPNAVIGNIDTPFDAASKTVDPLLFLAGKRSGQETAQGVISNFSGGPAELVKALGEYSTGSSAFTGADLQNPDGSYKINPLVRLSSAFAPNISKGLRVAGSPLAGPVTDNDRLRLIKALTGLQGKELTPKARDQAKNERLRSVEDIIKALTDAGVDVPTIEELQAIGVLEKTKRAG